VRGTRLYEGVVDRGDLVDALLVVTVVLDRVWVANEGTIRLLTQACSVAAVGLAIEVGALAVLLAGTLI